MIPETIISWSSSVCNFALFQLPLVIDPYASSNIKLGKIFSKQDNRSFVQNNKEKLENIDKEITSIWLRIAENPKNVLLKSRWIQCLSNSVSAIPLLRLTLASSSVLGFYGVGVVTLVVLTPVIGKLLSATLEFTDCESAKSFIDEANQQIALTRTISFITLISHHSFQEGGLYGGSYFLGKLAALYFFATKFLAPLRDFYNKKMIEEFKDDPDFLELNLKMQSISNHIVDDEQWMIDRFKEIFELENNPSIISSKQREENLKALIASYKTVVEQVDQHLTPLRAYKLKQYCETKLSTSEELLKQMDSFKKFAPSTFSYDTLD